VGELCRRLGVSEGTFYRWKAKYGGLEENEARRLKALEEETGRLKKIVAQQALDIDALKAVLSKKWYAHRRSGRRCVSLGRGERYRSGGLWAGGHCAWQRAVRATSAGRSDVASANERAGS
jgi:putative transposase